MDKIVVGFVGGNTNLDRAIKYFSDSEEYDVMNPTPKGGGLEVQVSKPE